MKNLFCLLLFFSSKCYPQSLGNEVFKTLLKNEQGLVDAIAAGDKNVWQKYLHDSCLITTEDGSVITKRKFIEDLAPLPKGYEGHIKIIEPRFNIHGNTAVLCFIDDEYLELYNQKIHTQYRQTDTWLKENGEWKMIAMQIFEIPKTPLPVNIDPAILEQYTGTYALDDKKACNVYMENKKLFVKKGDNRPVELLAQTEQVFFRQGDGRVDIIFIKNERGDYRMIERREGEDLVWYKRN